MILCSDTGVVKVFYCYYLVDSNIIRPLKTNTESRSAKVVSLTASVEINVGTYGEICSEVKSKNFLSKTTFLINQKEF